MKQAKLLWKKNKKYCAPKKKTNDRSKTLVSFKKKQKKRMSNFFSLRQLRHIGVKVLGNENIQISKKVIFYNPHNITIKTHVRIDDGVVLSAHSPINIGNYVHIARNCLFYSGSKIELHDFTTVSASCKFYGATDNYSGSALIGPTCPEQYRDVQVGDIILSRYAAIGTSCVVLPNTWLKEGCAVGALSLIRGELNAWSIYGGNPLKFLKARKQSCRYFGENLLPLQNKMGEKKEQ